MNDRYSAHGHVTITDDLGNVLVDKDNMIVLNGRKLFMNAMFGSSFTKPSFKIFFENKYTTPTREDLLYSDISEHIDASLTTDVSASVTDDAATIPYATITNTISGTGNVKYIASTGLLYGSSGDILFSRVTFDPVIIRTGRTYTVNYKIYF